MSKHSEIENRRLRDGLRAAADEWCAATGRTHGALSSLVANHGGALARLDDPASAITDLKLEQFARWLMQPGNWPESEVGEKALEFAHRVGVSVTKEQDHVV
ncbi:hypothetical protein [Erythrobacter rubeus]|uniref:Uncharacterized protein n=1 Tax=Erythrobacter rubeus TaxID=2760803 RepID=A0ABR8KTZ0_9SPHN|nr:hypothetical protein [Erythrobacter rubeus]MBD2842683.1 hypothetical protein [Erythrobacter rubeus]